MVLELPRDEAGHVLDEPDDELDETVHHEGAGQDVRNRERLAEGRLPGEQPRQEQDEAVHRVDHAEPRVLELPELVSNLFQDFHTEPFRYYKPI